MNVGLLKEIANNITEKSENNKTVSSESHKSKESFYEIMKKLSKDVEHLNETNEKNKKSLDNIEDVIDKIKELSKKVLNEDDESTQPMRNGNKKNVEKVLKDETKNKEVLSMVKKGLKTKSNAEQMIRDERKDKEEKLKGFQNIKDALRNVKNHAEGNNNNNIHENMDLKKEKEKKEIANGIDGKAHKNTTKYFKLNVKNKEKKENLDNIDKNQINFKNNENAINKESKGLQTNISKPIADKKTKIVNSSGAMIRNGISSSKHVKKSFIHHSDKKIAHFLKSSKEDHITMKNKPQKLSEEETRKFQKENRNMINVNNFKEVIKNSDDSGKNEKTVKHIKKNSYIKNEKIPKRIFDEVGKKDVVINEVEGNFKNSEYELKHIEVIGAVVEANNIKRGDDLNNRDFSKDLKEIVGKIVDLSKKFKIYLDYINGRLKNNDKKTNEKFILKNMKFYKGKKIILREMKISIEKNKKSISTSGERVLYEVKNNISRKVEKIKNFQAGLKFYNAYMEKPDKNENKEIIGDKFNNNDMGGIKGSSSSDFVIKQTDNEYLNGHLARKEGLNSNEIVNRVVDTIIKRSSENNFRETATLKLHPPELGKVEITIIKSGDNVEIRFKVFNKDAQDALERGIHLLSNRLDSHGFNVEKIEITQENRESFSDEYTDDENEQNRRHNEGNGENRKNKEKEGENDDDK